MPDVEHAICVLVAKMKPHPASGVFVYNWVMRYIWFLFLTILPLITYGHGGGLDSYGCHHNRKQGGYHCHRGTNAGISYSSQQEMLQQGSSSISETSKITRDESNKKTLPEGTHKGKVVGITDGDTLTLLVNNIPYKIRLAEIDTPEKRQPYGTQSKKLLSELAFGKEAIVDVQTSDRYGRSVARIYVGDVDVNAELVKQGAAWVYRKYAKDERLYELEKQAKEAKLGLWGLPETERIPPWEHRKLRSD